MGNDTRGNSNNDIEYTERAYSTSEVATMIDIAVPTVRKYAQSLESQGYMFIRTKGTGKHQARLFVEKDVTALRYLKDVREKGNTTVEQATSIVIERFGKGAIQSIRGNDIAELQPYNEQYNELKELIHNQNDLIKGLTDRLDQQQEYIKNRIEERDKLLMKSLNEMMETKKQIATAEENKGFFARLFNRNK